MSNTDFINKLKIIVQNNSSKIFASRVKSDRDLYEWLVEYTKKNNPANLNEMIWLAVNNNTPVKCINGNKTLFNTFDKGYRKSCENYKICGCKSSSQAKSLSLWHSSLSQDEKNELVSNQQQSLLEKYGVTNVMHLDSVKEKVADTNIKRYGNKHAIESVAVKEKITKTNLERYGVDKPLKSSKIRSKGLKTNLDRYGTLMGAARTASYDKYNGNNPFTDNTVKEKIKQTMIERYGVEHALQNKNIVQTMKDNLLSKINRESHEQLCISDELWDILNDKSAFEKIIANKTTAQIKEELGMASTDSVLKWVRKHDLLDIIKFNPASSMEEDMADWLTENDINYVRRNRSILSNNYELDFYISDHNLAIELHGLYYHSENCGKKDKHYHYSKYIECKDKNIQLLQIWQDE